MSIVEQPDSRLLSLPAEIRNAIYEHVATETRKALIVTGPDGVPRLSDVRYPLSRTCRQVRKEFASCAVEAARNNCFILRCKNFSLPSSKLVRELLCSLAPLDEFWVFELEHRCYSQHIFIDNDFDFNFTNKIKNVLGGLQGPTDWLDLGSINCHAMIHFDIATLDLDRLEHALELLSRTERRREYTKSEAAVSRALQNAIHRYRKQEPSRQQDSAKRKGRRGQERKGKS